MVSSLFSSLERSISFIDSYMDDILTSVSSRSLALDSSRLPPTSPSLLSWLSFSRSPAELEPVLCVPPVLSAVLSWLEQGLSWQCAEQLQYDRSCAVDVLEFFRTHGRLPEAFEGATAMCRGTERCAS